MASHTESKNIVPFNWRKFLSWENYTKQQLWEAVFISNDWNTCPCGQQDEAIPRNLGGVPLNLKLADLGVDFCDHIHYMYMNSGDKKMLLQYRDIARTILDKINALGKKLSTSPEEQI